MSSEDATHARAREQTRSDALHPRYASVSEESRSSPPHSRSSGASRSGKRLSVGSGSQRSKRSRELLDPVPEEETTPFDPRAPALLKIANEALTARQFWFFSVTAMTMLVSFFLHAHGAVGSAVGAAVRASAVLMAVSIVPDHPPPAAMPMVMATIAILFVNAVFTVHKTVHTLKTRGVPFEEQVLRAPAYTSIAFGLACVFVCLSVSGPKRFWAVVSTFLVAVNVVRLTSVFLLRFAVASPPTLYPGVPPHGCAFVPALCVSSAWILFGWTVGKPSFRHRFASLTGGSTVSLPLRDIPGAGTQRTLRSRGRQQVSADPIDQLNLLVGELTASNLRAKREVARLCVAH